MHLTLHLTTSCNMGCTYCYAPPRAGAAMSVEVGRRAIELGRRLNGDGSCGIIFFGGEPLLERGLIAELVDYARHVERRDGGGRFHFKVTTNGLLLDDEFLELTQREDILVAMSCDGDREAHDRHRRMAGGGPSFDRVWPRLERLLAERPYSSVIMVVNPDTAGRLDRSVEFLMDGGVRYLIVAMNYAAEWTEAALGELEGAYRRLADRYVEWTRAGRKFYLSPFEVKLASHIKGECFGRDRCELGQRQLSVDPAGYLYPCVQFPRAGRESRWCIGHVESGIDEAGREALRQESAAEKEPCRECAINTRCLNTCGCLNWQTTGATDRVSPVLCRHERLMVELADRVGEMLFAERDPLFLHKHYNEYYPVLSLLEDASGSP